MQRTLSKGEFSGRLLHTRRIANFLVSAISYQPNQVLPRHSHEHGYVSVALRGAYLEQHVLSSWECTAGGTIFHAPGECHQNRFFEDGAHLLVLELEPRFLSHLAGQGIETNRQYALTSPHCMQLAARLERILELSDPVSALSAEGLCLELLAEALRPCWEGGHEPRSTDWLPRVCEILRERYREHLTLSDIAGQVQVHPVHLARAFRKRYTCCIGDFIRKLRVEAACSELLESDAPIAEIAARSGFADQSHLSRVMKRHAGISPAEFRKTVRDSAGMRSSRSARSVAACSD